MIIFKKKTEEINKLCVGVGYGVYYEDVKTEDADELEKQKTDYSLGIKIGLLSICVVLVIATCVVVMLLL